MPDLNKKIESVYKNLWKIHHPDQPVPSLDQLSELRNEYSNNNSLMKYPKTLGFPPDVSLELTTARNKLLIQANEQKALQQSVICFFGLSVGSHAALTWMMESRANTIKISDPDTIDATNLNRLRFGWNEIGKSKVSVVKKQLLAVNPYASVQTLSKTSFKAIEKFINQNPRPSAIVDEIDSMEGKAFLRKTARKLKIPVLMAADVGDNVVMDIERYDLNPETKPFLGRIDITDEKEIAKLLPMEKIRLIIQLVGLEQNSIPMLNSLLAVGNQIPTWPQLGATATISGGIITTALKKIILKEKLLGGRYYFSLDDLFDSESNLKGREKLMDVIKDKFSL